MINISEIIRQQPETSFFKKLRSLRDPDIYLAENIRDYRENAPNLEFPWYKRGVPFVKDSDEGVYIYDILLRYLIKKDFPSIVEVRKYNFSNRKPEKESIMKRVRSFFPKG